jgi:hypothetical protein
VANTLDALLVSIHPQAKVDPHRDPDAEGKHHALEAA